MPQSATQARIHDVVKSQRSFFATGQTRDTAFRLQQLRKLRALIQQNEESIFRALHSDLRKPTFESYTNEVGFVLEEIKSSIRNLRKWAKPKKVRSPLVLFPARGVVYSEPYGVVLIMAPWNYPINLLLSPLVGSICAGNCAILKPSEVAPETEQLIAELINQNFPSDYLFAVQGGVDVCQELLEESFDYIFFTGSTTVGRIVMEAAARHLTPVSLELGGKSPCIVDKDADLTVTAKRITWGKFLNAGQTCVAPDYIYVERSVKQPLIERIGEFITQLFGDDPRSSPDYARIINDKHFQRLTGLIENQPLLRGGGSDPKDLFIAPTLMEATWDDPVMQDEIFGPILPFMGFESLPEVIREVNARPKPLALYLFSRKREHQQKVMESVSFGGGCINDCIVHLSNPSLPFGGVGQSGMGAYHGRYSFDTFSHEKGVLRNAFWFDSSLRYPPYTPKQLKMARFFFR